MTPPILAEGRSWLVIDKPAGLPVEPPRSGIESLSDLLGRYPPGRPQPVHRLDQDTSGCLLLARRRPALRRLMRAFEERRVAKLYWAIVANAPAAAAGLIDAPLAKRSSPAGGWRIVPDARGRPARTRWRVLGRADGLALLALEPETGRTHQLRVHATLLGPGAAILGDGVYGATHAAGLMLHARGLAFPDSDAADREPMIQVTAPVPARFGGFPALLPAGST
jgi:tRNA pseudouridine32 synthase/23S rRNA pseudouridine746 synthase